MQIDNNEKQKRALDLMRGEDKELGKALQDEFLEDVKAAKQSGEDYCNCDAPCKYHGKCFECVTVHRGHRDHLPYCLHSMVNERLDALSSLTEFSYGAEPSKK